MELGQVVLMELVSAVLTAADVVAPEAGMTPEVLALAEWVAAASPEELATGVSGDLAVMSPAAAAHLRAGLALAPPAAAAHLLAGLALAAEGMRALKVATVALAAEVARRRAESEAT